MISHNLLNVFYLNQIVFLVCVWIILESLVFILISQQFISVLCLSVFDNSSSLNRLNTSPNFSWISFTVMNKNTYEVRTE